MKKFIIVLISFLVIGCSATKIFSKELVDIEEIEGTTEQDIPYDNTEEATTEDWDNTTEDNTTELTTEESIPEDPVNPTTESEKIIIKEYIPEESTISLDITMNNDLLDKSLLYENDNGITQISFEGVNAIITVIDDRSTITCENYYSTNEPIKMLAVDGLPCYYRVKTKNKGWSLWTNELLVGTIDQSDYITGIQFSCSLADETDKILTLDTQVSSFRNSWDDHSGTPIKAIRISSNKKVTYRVFTDNWLPAVSNSVLAGDPFGDVAITGINIDTYDIIYRVQGLSGVWSEWETGNNSINLAEPIVDIQIISYEDY